MRGQIILWKKISRDQSSELFYDIFIIILKRLLFKAIYLTPDIYLFVQTMQYYFVVQFKYFVLIIGNSRVKTGTKKVSRQTYSKV